MSDYDLSQHNHHLNITEESKGRFLWRVWRGNNPIPVAKGSSLAFVDAWRHGTAALDSAVKRAEREAKTS